MADITNAERELARVLATISQGLHSGRKVRMADADLRLRLLLTNPNITDVKKMEFVDRFARLLARAKFPQLDVRDLGYAERAVLEREVNSLNPPQPYSYPHYPQFAPDPYRGVATYSYHEDLKSQTPEGPTMLSINPTFSVTGTVADDVAVAELSIKHPIGSPTRVQGTAKRQDPDAPNQLVGYKLALGRALVAAGQELIAEGRELSHPPKPQIAMSMVSNYVDPAIADLQRQLARMKGEKRQLNREVRTLRRERVAEDRTIEETSKIVAEMAKQAKETGEAVVLPAQRKTAPAKKTTTKHKGKAGA